MSAKTKKKTRESFGATAPPFIDYLKDILRRYPDGGQILKELIQNADDAQATEVVFIHDERSYGTESLWSDELGEYQGPALYAYNNAAFTDDDWNGIQMAGRSVKRNDPNKVGRFGIGFNSVYHITDLPGIFSSGHLGIMDPQEKIFGQKEADNRRHIKWQEEDQKHDEHAVWNELLMNEVLPQAYLMIIQDAIKLAQESILPVSSVYDLWPDITQIKHKDKWYTVALNALQHLFRQKVAVLSLAKDETMFITPAEAVFPCNGPTSPDILAAIKRTLVSCGENLVTLPDSVARAMKEAYPDFNTLKHVTPTYLRDILRRFGVHVMSQDDKLSLLEYILSDGKYRELEGLQLLPLSDGSFRCFTNREEDTALIDSNEFPRALLPFCNQLFIPDDLSPVCINHLKELARKNLFKVINMDADQVAEHTRRYLPQDWKKTRTGLVNWDISNSQHPPLDWLQEFWKFLNTHFKDANRVPYA
ncbi:Sacsin DnaJ-like protein subfamily C member 29 [Larimichthys crocea]|uniref:Sacsin DnaJ-like protein subfamily C member 29 n=1 Tax=Larimichthys crocea TaxID=215358 RepID=A0A6G0J740_LARCR|nr:Sacsin DnaJ-like protein subfamily C member 29 [Larimichthys crocea]